MKKKNKHELNGHASAHVHTLSLKHTDTSTQQQRPRVVLVSEPPPFNQSCGVPSRTTVFLVSRSSTYVGSRHSCPSLGSSPSFFVSPPYPKRERAVPLLLLLLLFIAGLRLWEVARRVNCWCLASHFFASGHSSPSDHCCPRK